MIKFFRHFRQAMIKENRASKYLLYAIGEIVLVVIGILIALQINTWNEDRKIRKSEQEILINLKSELILNRDQLDRTQQLHHKEYDAGVQLLNLFNTDVSNIAVNKLDSILAIFEMAQTFEANDGYIKSLLSSGKIDYLKSSALKAFFGSFEGQVIDATEEQYPIKRLFEDRLWPIIDGKINAANRIRLLSNYSTIPKGTYESTYVWFFESREIEDIVSNILAWRLDLMDDENTLLENINLALEIIDEEL